MQLEEIWYVVLGLSVLFYTVLDGFDLGVGALHLFAKNDLQRRTFLNAIGPVWDGNEVWIVIVMGGLFAGFPNVYASLFSGFYSLLMILIAGLMFRAAAIEFRSKRESLGWRKTWDIVFSFASLLVAFIIGVILGNMIQGIPLNAEQDYIGTFSDFFTFYSVLTGFFSIFLFSMHGAIYLTMKTEGETHEVVRYWIFRAIFLFLITYFTVTVFTFLHMPHMVAPFKKMPYLGIFPLLALVFIGLIPYQIKKGNDGRAFIASCMSIFLFLILYGIGTFPTLVHSTVDPELNSLTIYNTASSAKTLQILLTVVAIGLPIVLGYGFWVYRVFRGKVRLDKSSY